MPVSLFSFACCSISAPWAHVSDLHKSAWKALNRGVREFTILRHLKKLLCNEEEGRARLRFRFDLIQPFFAPLGRYQLQAVLGFRRASAERHGATPPGNDPVRNRAFLSRRADTSAAKALSRWG